MNIVNSKPIKLFSLLAGLFISVCGGEVKADNLPSDNHSNELSVLTTADVNPSTTPFSTTSFSVTSQAITLRQAIAPEDEAISRSGLEASSANGSLLDRLLSRPEQTFLTFNGLLEDQKADEKETITEGPRREGASAQSLISQSIEPVNYPSTVDEASAPAVENDPTVDDSNKVMPSASLERMFLLDEAGVSQADSYRADGYRADGYRADGYRADGYQVSETASMPSNAFPRDTLLLADGGAPDFGDTLFWSPSRPDSHAPIGVMGDHTHGKGEFMFSYRYMFMDMDGNRSGTESLSEAEVLQDFMVTPVEMTMQMHMLGAMYAPTEELTLMAMLPYVTKEMDHLTRNGMRFTTSSDGIGDVSFGGLYTLLDENRQRIHLNLGVSFPTGSINERDATPMGPNQILPYPMQIGSGTFDFQPGVTYLGQSGRWSWGSQAMGKIRVGENSNGYRLGNQFMLTGWGARSWTDWFSTSLRLNGRTNGNISGADARLNPSVIPTADPDLRAGTQLDVGLGLNFYAPEGNWQGTRFAVEFNVPVYRALSGPQLETDFTATAGLQTSF